MSEWLTTGQMIDKLKVGEVAVLEEKYRIPEGVGKSYYCVAKHDDGDILWCKEDGSHLDKEPLQLFGHVCNWKWCILPKHVSFEEAMKAHEKGKVVYYCGRNKEYKKQFKLSPSEKIIRIGATSLEVFSILNLYKGKWTIED